MAIERLHRQWTTGNQTVFSSGTFSHTHTHTPASVSIVRYTCGSLGPTLTRGNIVVVMVFWSVRHDGLMVHGIRSSFGLVSQFIHMVPGVKRNGVHIRRRWAVYIHRNLTSNTGFMNMQCSLSRGWMPMTSLIISKSMENGFLLRRSYCLAHGVQCDRISICVKNKNILIGGGLSYFAFNHCHRSLQLKLDIFTENIPKRKCLTWPNSCSSAIQYVWCKCHKTSVL